MRKKLLIALIIMCTIASILVINECTFALYVIAILLTWFLLLIFDIYLDYISNKNNDKSVWMPDNKAYEEMKKALNGCIVHANIAIGSIMSCVYINDDGIYTFKERYEDDSEIKRDCIDILIQLSSNLDDIIKSTNVNGRVDWACNSYSKLEGFGIKPSSELNKVGHLFDKLIKIINDLKSQI